nr:hypothetical protein [Tanacetum cinerariifolium]
MVIKKLKERIKSLSGNMRKDKIKQELEEIKTINIKLDHRVTKLIAQNEHLKQTYKQLYDSIKSSRIRLKEQCDDLIKQVNIKSVENSDLNASLQEKLLVITALKDKLRKLKGKVVVDEAVILHPIDPELFKIDPSGNTKKDKIQQTPSSSKKNKIEAYPWNVRSSLSNKNCVVKTRNTASVQNSKSNVNSDLQCVTCNGCLFSDNHDSCVLEYINNVNACLKSKSVKKTVKRKIWKPTGKVFTNIGYIWRPTVRTFTIVGNVFPLTRITTTTEVPLRKPIVLESNPPKPVVVQIVLWYLDSGCSKHMTGDRSQLTNFVNKFLGTVKFGNDHVGKIMGYGDYQIRNVTISRVYFVEGPWYNLFSVRQFCDSDLEVAFRQHTCFIRNLEGVDLLIKSQGNNLYTLSLGDMIASSPICLLSKASMSKYWLWHQRLSHLNFGAINYLARQGLVRGLPKLKFEKDHLRSACAMGKSKKKSHKPKSEDTNQEKLYLLHMDLCGPMRVESVNGKKLASLMKHQLLALHSKRVSLKDAEAVATACYTQNCSIVRLRHGKTPYEVLHGKLPDLSFLHVFGALCYPTNDSKNVGKLQLKADIALEVIAPIDEVVAPEPAESTSSPSSTTVDQDTPSP